jgi:hypothetical protein
MFDAETLARPGLALDFIHDDRHALTSGPTARESMPYMINSPDVGVAGFIYTWVNGASEGGAILALFGPAVGEQPLVERLADRPVPRDMTFADWKIEGLSIRHDLQFDHADVRWDSPRAKLDLSFDAFHPPYAYGANAEGCPSYTAVNRIEQSGRMTGSITIDGKAIPYDGLGHRDHSWGTRDWGAFQHYNWFEGQTADGVSVHFWRFIALGKVNLRGYVYKDGLLAEVTSVKLDVTFGDDLWQKRLSATVLDEAGRTTEVKAEFYAHYTLIPSPLLHLREGAARATFDGKPGTGWMEVAWPPGYLDHVSTNGPY